MSSATRVLERDVAAVTTAANARNVNEVEQALRQLDDEVSRQQAGGSLAADKAARILAISASLRREAAASTVASPSANTGPTPVRQPDINPPAATQPVFVPPPKPTKSKGGHGKHGG